MAQYIKDNTRHEALAVGESTVEKKTFKMLFDWSDYIIDMRDHFEDYWHDPRHPILQEKVKEIWKSEEKHL